MIERAGESERRRDLTDAHSYSQPRRFPVVHIDLELGVSFATRALEGVATLTLQENSGHAGPFVLDTRELTIHEVHAAGDDGAFTRVDFTLGPVDPILGSALFIDLSGNERHVRIRYTTSPAATALQWLDPIQTAGKRLPFLFTQSQAIHARSWIPVQDTPAARLTYTARIRVPDGLVAVMSATNQSDVRDAGLYKFRMGHPIPPYLIALAVGDLVFASTSPRTGVFAEREIIARAIYEFAEAEQMLKAAEEQFGPYLWERFDTLVLPPSFPFGGMENPGVIFVTPTLLAGDRSAVSVITHELAHAWSGNLVTNATWDDFWLNEGFTTYIEYRLQERLYGKRRADIEQVLAFQRLEEEMAALDPRDQILHQDLTGRNPDDAVTSVPYVKGALFLKALENAFGRPAMDEYLRSYFSHFAFQSITTAEAIAYLDEHLLRRYPDRACGINIDEWLSAPGLLASAPRPASEALTLIEQQAGSWYRRVLSPENLHLDAWSADERLHFLRSLPWQLSAEQLAELDRLLGFGQTNNAEILQQWLLMAVRNRYSAAYPRVESFLLTVGRRIFIKPLYEELARTAEGQAMARSIYQKARRRYHPVAQGAIDKILGFDEAGRSAVPADR